MLRITEINTQPADDTKPGRHCSKTYISPLPILPLLAKLMILVFLTGEFKK